MGEPPFLHGLSGYAIRKRTVFIVLPDDVYSAPIDRRTKLIVDSVTAMNAVIIGLQYVSKSVRVTIKDIPAKNRLVDSGLTINGERVDVVPAVDTSDGLEAFSTLHVFDVPLWVDDSAIVNAVTVFGTVSGKVRHGYHQLSSTAKIPNGTRYVSVKLNRAVPSYITVQYKKVRVWHVNQKPTCRVCNALDHIAKNWPGAHIADSRPIRTDCIRFSIGPGLTMVGSLYNFVLNCSRLTQCTQVRFKKIRTDRCIRLVMRSRRHANQQPSCACWYNFRPTDLQSAQKFQHVGIFRPIRLDSRVRYRK